MPGFKDSFRSAFASNVLKTLWDPSSGFVFEEIQKIIDMDKTLIKIEICKDEALDLLYKVPPSCRREAEKLAKYCYKVEDISEDIKHEIEKLKLSASSSHKILKFPNNWTIPHKLDTLKNKMVEAIANLRHRMDFSREIRRQPHSMNFNDENNFNERELIGRDSDIQTIVENLLCWEEGGKPGVSIVGMRGVGKTALANYILHREEVQEKFPLILRASMSGKNFKENDLVSSLEVIYDKNKRFKKTRGDENTLQILKEDTAWLIMLDDLEASVNIFREFHRTFLSTGRKLLITTLNSRVGQLAQTSIHHLKPLSEELCQRLICRELDALLRPSFTPSPSLRSELAMKSQGLPLVAIFLVHSLLNMEDRSHYFHESPMRWPKFEEEILPVFKSGLTDLKTLYKRCFVYLSLLPHKHVFTREDIILLWIGEKLVEPNASKFDGNGLQVFNELHEKSIIQFFLVDSKGVLWYEMNKFIHDIALNMGSKTFVRINVECTLSSDDWNKYTYHLSLSCIMEAEHWDQIEKNLRHLRTLFVVGNNPKIPIEIPQGFFEKVCKLRVLCFNNSHICKLPENINKLRCLNYLDFSLCFIEDMPCSLVQLSTLQILKLRKADGFPGLPANFFMLSNLVYVDWNENDIKVMKSKLKSVSNHVNLRTLPLFVVGNREGYLIDELRNMNCIEGSIKIIDLQHVSKDQAERAMLSCKSSLHRLELEWKEGENVSNAKEVLTSLEPHDHLKELKIMNYNGDTFPEWLTKSVTKLQKLELLKCHSCCNLPALGLLSDLKTLVLNNMAELEDWEGLEANTLPCLLELKIIECPKLKNLPTLDNLSSLVKLHLENYNSFCKLPPKSLKKLTIKNCDRMKKECEDGGKHRSIIVDIYEVFIDGVKLAKSDIEPISSVIGETRDTSIKQQPNKSDLGSFSLEVGSNDLHPEPSNKNIDNNSTPVESKVDDEFKGDEKDSEVVVNKHPHLKKRALFKCLPSWKHISQRSKETKALSSTKDKSIGQQPNQVWWHSHSHEIGSTDLHPKPLDLNVVNKLTPVEVEVVDAVEEIEKDSIAAKNKQPHLKKTTLFKWLPQWKLISRRSKERHRKASQSAEPNNYPHRVSRGEYASLEQIINEETYEQIKKDAAEKGVDASTITRVMDHATMWKHAHQKPSGEYDTQSSGENDKRIDHFMQEEAKRTFNLEGRNDVLSTAYGGKERHPGRVRGVGRGFGISKCFSRATKTKKQSCTKEEAVREMITVIGKGWFEYKRSGGVDVSEMPQYLENVFASFLKEANIPATDTQFTPYQSTQNFSALETHVSPTHQNISTPPSTTPIYNSELETTSSLGQIEQLDKAYLKVQIVDPVVRFCSLPVNIGNEIQCVDQALGTFVACPTNLVGHDDDDKGGEDAGDTGPSKSIDMDGGVNDGNERMDVDALKKLKMVHTNFKHDQCVSITFPEEITGVEETIMVGKDTIWDLLSGDWLDVPWLQLGIAEAYDKCQVVVRNDITFGSPYIVSKYHTMESSFSDHLMMKFKTLVPIVIIPLNRDANHWLLVVIFPKDGNAFVLDSKGEKIIKAMNSDMKDAIDTEFRRFDQHKRSLFWETIQVPKQPNSYECAYYVVKFMLDIVDNVNSMATLTEFFKKKGHLTQKEFKQIQVTLASNFLNRCDVYR